MQTFFLFPMDKYSYISHAHGQYIEELYEAYRRDPNNVETSWQYFFQGFEFSLQKFGENGSDQSIDTEKLKKEIAVRELIDAYRSRGHLEAKTNPVRERLDRNALLELEHFGLSDRDLDTVFQAGELLGIGATALKEIVKTLKYIYCATIGFEYTSIREPEVLAWYRQKVESDSLKHNLAEDQKKRILRKLNESVVFENFLHTKYIGQKRFSLEGGESIIPGLDATINKAAELGVKQVVIGMAHRGRLNILANIMGKTYEEIFSEFEGQVMPDETMGDGDVKYHLGFSSQITAESGEKLYLELTPNPSHLEAVDTVVTGYVRAEMEEMYDSDNSKILPILIHGDAALAGQGIVYELVQMSKLSAYQVGGTVHFIINNQVGFTTDFHDARSSIYCTDISQIVEAPEIHVNGDNPEAVVFAAKLAIEFRQKFKRDIFVDIVCYRKHGHNESDEPRFTQPKLYEIISKHPDPREMYIKKLQEGGEMDVAVAKTMDQDFRKLLNERLGEVRQRPLPYKVQKLEKQWAKLRKSKKEDFLQSPVTGISKHTIEKVGKVLTSLPEGFKPLKQISKLIKERKTMFFETKTLNWASAELLAYGSLLLEKKSVRFTGQDVERGTFSHRHAILTDTSSNEKYNNLNHIEANQGKMMIYNSLLSEYGVLGFEFGYAMANPDILVIWEAQFGDFANGAQVITDQFITSSESKWHRMNGLVMLLPHGYEGQGPEHSNARPERFLQLSAEQNIVVCNLTTPANIFHALRRQLTWDFRKPMILMSPKSMLRHPSCVSPISDFVGERRFKEIYDDTDVNAQEVVKVLMCTGKVYYDLLQYKIKEKRNDVAIIRIEQLHPFPAEQLEVALSSYKKMKQLIWVQEEPVNMGYWTYILRTYHQRKDLQLVTRKPSASPSTGYAKVHLREQERIIYAAFNR